MTLLGTAAMLGLGTLLIELAPGLTREQLISRVRGSLLIAGFSGMVLGLVIGPVLGQGGDSLADLTDPAVLAVFVLGCALTAASLVLDQVLLTRRGGGQQTTRNIIASAVKLLALVPAILVLPRESFSLLATWVGGLVVSMVYVAVRTSGAFAALRWNDVSEVLRARRRAGSHHVLNLTLQAPYLVVPVVAAWILTAEQNAYFSTARLITGLVVTVPFSLTIGLFVAAEGNIQRLTEQMRRSVPSGLFLALAAEVVLLAFGQPILRVFGPEYAENAWSLLVVMSLAVFPLVFKDHYVAMRRVEGRLLTAASLVTAMTILEVAAAALGGATGGALGLVAAWTVAVYVEGAVTALPVIRQLRSHRNAGDPPS
jgi:O-antigen/teichoic acid export membrane protein